MGDIGLSEFDPKSPVNSPQGYLNTHFPAWRIRVSKSICVRDTLIPFRQLCKVGLVKNNDPLKDIIFYCYLKD